MKSINDAPTDLQQAIREFFPESEWDHAASVAFLESGWNPYAMADSTESGKVPCGTIIGNRDGTQISAERSISYFQINACNFPDWYWPFLFHTRHNVGTAHMLWSSRGWSPWYFSAKTLGLL